MGGSTFSNTGKGKSVQEAFDRVVSEARHEHGHGGYSGTIAEKHSFTTIQPPFTRAEGVTDREWRKQIDDFANKLIDDGDPRVDDKWGPAGCICISAPDEPKKLTRAAAEKLAKEKFGESATIEMSRSNGQSHAALYVVAKTAGMGMNTQVLGGWKNRVRTESADDADSARGLLFAKPGEWVFFGWASD